MKHLVQSDVTKVAEIRLVVAKGGEMGLGGTRVLLWNNGHVLEPDGGGDCVTGNVLNGSSLKN